MYNTNYNITLYLPCYGWNLVILTEFGQGQAWCVAAVSAGLHQLKPFEYLSQTASPTSNLALFISNRRQSFQWFPVRWNQRGEKDPEKQKPPKDVRRLGTADERHRDETHKECRRGEVSLSNVVCFFLANPFFDPFFLFSNPVCCLLFHRISVTFNVNNSIPPNFEEEAEQGQQKSGEEEVCWTQADLLNLHF